jgi:hypothetical protein
MLPSCFLITFVCDSQNIYTKAAKAELAREYDLAFRSYVKAADAFLHLSRSSYATAKEKESWSSQAGKALDRAERIKAFVDKSKAIGAVGLKSDGANQNSSGSSVPELNLTPVDVNPFSPRKSQFLVHQFITAPRLNVSFYLGTILRRTVLYSEERQFRQRPFLSLVG